MSQQRADEKRKKESRREWKRSLPELRIVSRKFPFDSPRNTDPQGDGGGEVAQLGLDSKKSPVALCVPH